MRSVTLSVRVPVTVSGVTAEGDRFDPFKWLSDNAYEVKRQVREAVADADTDEFDVVEYLIED